MQFQEKVHRLFLSFAALAFLACGTNGSTAPPGTDPKEGDSLPVKASEAPATTNYCKEKCMEHETNCGDPDPSQTCGGICTEYQPLIWEVDCANAAECGDWDVLLACMPDPKCQARCEAHERDCGDPDPSQGCSKICGTYKPTPNQVGCAEQVACGDVDGLIACVRAP